MPVACILYKLRFSFFAIPTDIVLNAYIYV